MLHAYRQRATPLLAEDDPSIIAVASDETLPGLRIPVLDLDDVPAVAALILERLELECRP